MTSKRTRDYQKSRVYAWENKFIHPRCTRVLCFKECQAFVDGIFLCEGLIGAPKVIPMPKQNRTAMSKANRKSIWVQDTIPASVLIHEMAHSLTMTIDNKSDDHGPDFVGVYIKLLDKYMGIPLALSMYTLSQTKIVYNLGAQYYFTDRKVA